MSPERFLAWLGSHERGFLFGVAALLVGLSAFALLAGEVMEGESAWVDRTILLAMRNPDNLADPVGPVAVEIAARDITALGGTTVLALLTLGIGGYLMLDGKRRLALFLWGSVCTGVIAGSLLKLAFDRPRPTLVPHATEVSYSSFPSGHAMLSAVTFLTIGALLARSDDRRRMRAYFMLVASILTIAVGISRVYLGVHWPSDVLAGWTAGACWSLLCWTAARWLQRRHKIETDAGGQE